MKTGLVNYRIVPAMDNGSVLVHRAAKTHHCAGGHNGQHRTICNEPIKKGSTYVEYVGETSPFHSGYRYHPKCACEQGLLEQIKPTVELNCGPCFREGKGVVFGCTTHTPETQHGGR